MPEFKVENSYEILCDTIFKYFQKFNIEVKNNENIGLIYGKLIFSKNLNKEWDVENNYWKIQPFNDKELSREEVVNYLKEDVIVSKDTSLRKNANNNIFYAVGKNNELFLGFFIEKAKKIKGEFYKRKFKKIADVSGNLINTLPTNKSWGNKYSTKAFINVKLEERKDFEDEVINKLFNKDIDILIEEIKKIEIDKEEDINTYLEYKSNEEETIYSKEIDTPLNLILYGPPGTGKTYNTINYAVSIIEKKEVDEVINEAKKNRKEVFVRYKNYLANKKIIFTTFHQNYSYDDFIQGIRANTNNTETLSFIKEDGVFKDLVERAKVDPENNYVIIIDEINRGNISRIFGELITLIEEDKRLGMENETKITLPSKEIFAVPSNLFIIGTMNTADKSLALIDLALRRRFDFISMYPDYTVIPNFEHILRPINKAIYDEKKSADYLLGHAFFINKNEKDLKNIMNKKIIPLLSEYLFNNEHEIKDILSKGGIIVEKNIDNFQLQYKGLEE
ncbi:McrB family protein [Clostridium tarantellae]|uniref:AAA domain-containing protein n=1 Tax=Clostridium tarantellae TaxID=39493 RepID=A0A6I1MS70_9CLOT|nr:AAA family ATPase [Clostridium tarantellae]MPQ45037.1 AAA domain-containing protein [Clostridium tarantellae]